MEGPEKMVMTTVESGGTHKDDKSILRGQSTGRDLAGWQQVTLQWLVRY